MNQVNRVVAQELNTSEDIVKKVNSYYWSAVKKAIASSQYTSVRVKNWGTVTISRHKLYKRIKFLIKNIRFLRTTDKVFIKKSREEYEEEATQGLRILLQRRNELSLIYETNNIKYKAKKLRRSNLAKQKANLTGTIQQNIQTQESPLQTEDDDM